VSGPLDGRVVLITGAARGIGAQLARMVAARSERLAALAVELGDEHAWAECDVTDQAGLERAVAEVVARLGGIDVVVANAGVAPYGTVAVAPPDALARTVEVNLIGVMRTVSATLPEVFARRGYLLLISSVAAFSALPGLAAYAAAKAGVEQFGNVLRLEVAHRGVAVGTAHPIWIDTDLVRDAREDLDVAGTTRRLPGPLGRTYSVEECASALLRGIERRQRRVFVPRSMAILQAARTLLNSSVGDLVLRGPARTSVPEMEQRVRELGRSFGRHSMAQTRTGPGDSGSDR
jgi:NAD(P)-dependent dehydrogenase (short-subunit alcohol dehydrogenase family)